MSADLRRACQLGEESLPCPGDQAQVQSALDQALQLVEERDQISLHITGGTQVISVPEQRQAEG